MNTLPPEAERRLNNVINLGIVTQVNHDDAVCRVQIDSNETDWLPFGGTRMGNVKVWNPPSVGEQVLVISENGELDTAVVTSSFDYDDHPMPSSNANSIEIHCKDGAVFSYDHTAHQLDVRLPTESTTNVQSNTIHVSGDNIEVRCKEFLVGCNNYRINCSNYHLNSSSNNQDGELVINGTPYLNHTHKKVTPGKGNTGDVNG